MEINKPYQGILKGFGQLQTDKQTQRRPFPRIRNRSELPVSHQQSNDYVTSKNYFRVKEGYGKPTRSRPKDKLELSIFQTIPTVSETKAQFRRYQNARPPSLYRDNEHGTGIDEYQFRTGDVVNRNRSTFKDSFNGLSQIKPEMNISYRYSRHNKWDPINGNSIQRRSFGYQDYSPDNFRSYQSHNPGASIRQSFNIISGSTIE